MEECISLTSMQHMNAFYTINLLNKLSRIPVQPLLMHLFLDVNNSELTLIEENQQILYDLGFNVELAGQNQIRLKVPADIKPQESEDIFREILISLSQLHTPTPQEIRHSCLAMTACKSSYQSRRYLKYHTDEKYNLK